ncbi:MAG TPA: ABC transporter permease [Bryobacteraceae bacterium]|nr:ABC transporter permease [Bryobacteraceae bacterium]
MQSFLSDLEYALRTLRQSPGFTVTAVAALAMGIAANTAIFTVVNTVILRPLPFADSDRIVSLGRRGGLTASIPMFTWWEQDNPGLENLAACLPGASMNLNGGDKPELVAATRVSRNYFRLFGANPILGRTATAEEDRPGGPRALVMSFGLWQRRFGGDPSILGRTIALGGAPYTVVGVLSPGFTAYPAADVWMPLQADPHSTDQAHVLLVSARLPRGVSLAEANTRLAAIGKQYVEAHPQQLVGNDDQVEVSPLRQQLTGNIRPALLILLGAVGLVLLIACANVANLLLARATARQREIAIRAALGAGRARIVRQLLTESLLLALGGGAIGLALGSWGVRVLLHLTPGDLPRLQEMAAVPALDPRVAGFTLLVTAITGALFGLFPALQISLVDLASALKESSGRVGTGLRQNRTRSLLVGAEVAIAAVLLCGALLLIRSFAAMHAVSLGFEPRNLLTMQVSLGGPGYAKSGVVDRLARRVVERAEQIPGVESAAFASALPLQGRQDMLFSIPGRQPLQGYYFTGDVQWRIVSPRYFDTLRIPLLSGRFLRDQEPGRTVVISQAMARKYWPDANPVGQTIVIGPRLGPDYEAGPTEIVGVAGDVRERLNIDPAPVMYQAPSQVLDAAMALVNRLQPAGVLIRTRPGVAPMSVSPAVQQALLALDQLPASDVRTMDQVSRDSTARQNFNLLLLGLFAAMALLLGAVGIYGVMSYSVEQRTHEIGIRAALGAGRRDTLKLVLLGALRTAIAGVAVGIAASFGLTRLLTSQLFGVKPSDPLTFAVVPAVLIAVALSAAGIPALRATRIDPLTALRHE